MGKHSRDKGARFERAVATAFRTGLPFLRPESIERCGGQQGNGARMPDVFVPGHPCLWIECKVGGPARYPDKALLQAMTDMAGSGRASFKFVALAVCKEDRKDPFVYMALEDLIRCFGHTVNREDYWIAAGLAYGPVRLSLDAFIAGYALVAPQGAEATP